MKRRSLYLMPVVLWALACQSNRLTASLYAVSDSAQNQKTTVSLPGKWIISATETNGMRMVCNACPSIQFHQNGAATVLFPDASTGHYTWLVQKDTLILQSQDPGNTFPYFHATRYQMVFRQQKIITELTLTSGTMRYFLNRTEAH